MKLSAVIIDDLARAREVLKSTLKGFDEIQLLGEADGVTSGVKLVQEVNPELIFLDVEMGNQTGFDLLDALPDLKAKVIFTTAHGHYAIKAIKYSAFYYILKPIGESDLREALDKLVEESHLPEVSELLKNLEEAKRISLKTFKGYRFFDLNEIMYFDADDNYTVLKTTKGERVHINYNLKSLSNLLDSDQFLRVHRKHLVNKVNVEQARTRDNTLVMNNGDEIPVSRRRMAEVVQAF